MDSLSSVIPIRTIHKFIRKLDNRCSSSTHARFPREVGSPALKDPPANCKDWLLSQSMGNTSTSDPGQESEELFSANEASNDDEGH